MANDADLETALNGVGPRLRDLRQRREITLTQLSETTGISVSTLSRLESGARKPTLELLLPLARAYQVSLDELVDAPETGDPRVRARPIERHGRTYIPLTRRPGGLQAFKQILPPDAPDCDLEQKTHDGYEWLYVLSGRVRLILGDHDLTLTPGEAAEFDTRLPHLILNPGPEPAEILNLFGPQGERLHVRARSTPR
ncbi:helix-turn-helix domain-containing protein [Actinoplanes sp. GCM10030250]|uniref:helix-turn-helix domain-containing protein n=1 Tax=Actinoplanes sp. GCM10030250 TaxID=3273376 RepID=UPI00361BABEF